MGVSFAGAFTVHKFRQFIHSRLQPATINYKFTNSLTVKDGKNFTFLRTFIFLGVIKKVLVQ